MGNLSNWILKNTDRLNVDWIHLAQGKKLPAFVSTVMIVQFPQNAGDFLTSWGIISSYRRTTPRRYFKYLWQPWADRQQRRVPGSTDSWQNEDITRTWNQRQSRVGWLLGGNDEAPVSAAECTFQKAHRIADTNATGLRVFAEALTTYCGNRRGGQRIEALCSVRWRLSWKVGGQQLVICHRQLACRVRTSRFYHHFNVHHVYYKKVLRSAHTVYNCFVCIWEATSGCLLHYANSAAHWHARQFSGANKTNASTVQPVAQYHVTS